MCDWDDEVFTCVKCGEDTSVVSFVVGDKTGEPFDGSQLRIVRNTMTCGCTLISADVFDARMP